MFKEYAFHLIKFQRKDYTLTTNFSDSLYVGITLNWNYIVRTVDLSIHIYIDRVLQQFTHISPHRQQQSPHS